jgi:putative ABC transport system permease protein
MNIFLYEFRLALIRLWRRRTQSTLTLATFTISISLALLGWSLFHTIFLQNPAYDPKGEFYRIGQTGGMFNGRVLPASREDFDAWKEQQTVFTDFTPVMLYESIFVETSAGAERLLSANLSADALRLVNAKPLMGRLFTPDEDKIGTAPVIILSEKTWRNKFAADPNIINRLVKVDSEPATVVGVMPASFRFPNDQEMWQPLGYNPYQKTAKDPRIDVIARLKPGITIERAVEDLKQIIARRGTDTWAARYNLHPIITPLREYYLLPDMHQSAMALFALALLFVLVSCANAANLVMVDFFGRTGEISSTLALGIPRAAAIRTLCIQLLALATIAALIGCYVLIMVAPYVHSAMARIVTPYWLLFSLQWHHFAVAALLAVGSAAIAIIAPMSYLLIVDPEQTIRNGAGANRGTGRALWRRGLMIGQIALLTVLAISAGLLFRSSRHLGEDKWGYDARKIFSAKTALKNADFPTPAIRLTTHLRFIDEMERTPGIAAAAFMTNPVGFSGEADVFYAKSADGLLEGRSEGAVVSSSVTSNILSVFNLPLVAGESLSREEKIDGPLYALINQSLATRIWPAQEAVGRTLFIRNKDPKQKPVPISIRGVFRDFQAAGPKAKINDVIYVSIKGGMWSSSFLVARGQQALPSTEEIRSAAQRADPRLIVYFPGSVQTSIETELSSVRLTTRLSFVYAAAALVLCAVGVYSITVSQILQRSREFGIRMALGIDAQRLWERFTFGHLVTATIGVSLGLITAIGLVRLLQSLLYGVSGRDPIIFISVALIIVAVAVLACVPSLFRLRRINPADCLRSL